MAAQRPYASLQAVSAGARAQSVAGRVLAQMPEMQYEVGGAVEVLKWNGSYYRAVIRDQDHRGYLGTPPQGPRATSRRVLTAAACRVVRRALAALSWRAAPAAVGAVPRRSAAAQRPNACHWRGTLGCNTLDWMCW